MNVLSLFDGMSCGQQALERAGIKVDNYFASEIDKYAIKVTMANYPNTIQLGSVVSVDGYKLPQIDLLIGGSPCQSFSFAGKRKGMATKCETEILTLEHYLQLKAEGYEFEGQSYLFWEFMRLLNECKPKYFLLENVEMGEKWEKVLSKAIGVNGIHINSALLSAQNRKRIYWTNIGMQPGGLFGDLESIIKQPKDKGILLCDVLETEVDEKYFLSEKSMQKILKYNNSQRSLDNNGKSICLQAGYSKIGHDNQFIVNKKFTGLDLDSKSKTIRTGGNGTPTNKHNWDLIIHSTMGRSGDPKKGGTGHLSRNDGKTYCLDTGNTNAVEVREVKQISTNNKSNGGTQPYQQDRIYDIDGISPALSAGKSDLMITDNYIQWDSSGKGNKSQGERAYFEDGKSGTLSRGSENSGQVQPKVLITNPKEIKELNENQLKKFNPNINSDKANTLTLAQGRAGSSEEYMDSVSKIANITLRIRRLTPIECERLQTVADNYTNHVSDSQRYKMLGNGWTVDVIAYIFSYI